MGKRFDEIREQTIKIVTAIRIKHGGGNDFVPKADIEGTLSCPVCGKGEMTYFISSYNGHRHAHCPCFGNYCE